MNTSYINKIRNAAFKFMLMTLPLWGVGGGLLCSCSSFLDETSDRVMDADEDHLSTASDTIYSVLGIVNKMQAIADRTILLGEVRADLVDVNTNTSSDLRDVALFNVGDGNAYNSPAEYYAIINNCNYYLKNVAADLKNARNQYIFRKECGVVKGFRAWTYLQLALNYGSVPFITEPILTKEESEKDYPKYNIQQICEYFLNDLKGLENYEIPQYGSLRGVDSRLFYFPINILLGDLNLWAGNYREAALCYYKYLDTRNGTNVAAPVGIYSTNWMRSSTKWNMKSDSWSSPMFSSETYGNELITLIPGDSIPAEGNYSQLRNLFNTTESNGYATSIDPSQAIKDLSANQVYCHYTEANQVMYAPNTLEGTNLGDLRLGTVYNDDMHSRIISGGKTYTQVINQKYTNQSVHIYRQTMVYMRMAEALNRAGFPRFAFAILKNGVNNKTLANDVLPYYKNDSTYLAQFDFPTDRYILRTSSELASENTFGIHSHGSGWSEKNEYYVMPFDENNDSTLTAKYSTSDLLQKQIEGVEDLLVDEEALEFAFEGYRFYDLMRIALRRSDPSYLANRVYARRGESNIATMKSEIKKDLNNTANWYLPLK